MSPQIGSAHMVMPYADPEARRAYLQAYMRGYQNRPEVKARRAEAAKRPDQRAKKRATARVRYHKDLAANREYQAAYKRATYPRLREKILEQNKSRHAADPRRQMVQAAKRRALRDGLQFSLTIEDLQMPECCPVFGTPFETGQKVARPTSPSLDRLDNTKGYVPGNVWIISRRANVLKSDATIEELKTLVTALEAKWSQV